VAQIFTELLDPLIESRNQIVRREILESALRQFKEEGYELWVGLAA
jgi:AcrR family transcriptional regulator